MPQDPNHTPEDTFAIPEIIPFFPLSNVVFFPHTFLPLHIFEPRYRDMVKDQASTGQCIGMALLKEGWEADYYGAPPIHSVGCVGRLVTVASHPDGRYDIVLKGIARCRYDEQTVSTRYRQARITMDDNDPEACRLDPPTRTELSNVAETYLTRKHAHDVQELIVSQDVSDVILVNSLAAGLDFTPFEKQFILESEHFTQRARRLTELLKFKLADLHPSTHG